MEELCQMRLQTANPWLCKQIRLKKNKIISIKGTLMSQIAQNLKNVQEKIAQTLRQCGRDGEHITLVAVTKTHPVELIDEALRLGITHIAENKVQEAERKIPLLSAPYEAFHFIGRLQTNKINKLLSLNPALVQSVGSLYLAQELNRSLGRKNLTQDILVQINTTAEETKSGVDLDNAEDMIWQIASLSSLRIRGLMTMGVMSLDPEKTRPFFRQLFALKEKLESQNIPGVSWEHLSMGMSGDFEVALQEGANMLRLGSVIFGQRNYG